jgi:predicted acetyltransferase
MLGNDISFHILSNLLLVGFEYFFEYNHSNSSQLFNYMLAEQPSGQLQRMHKHKDASATHQEKSKVRTAKKRKKK